MQCKTCEYPLWNLKARQCPECGTSFLPSEFEFVMNSVCYCCPHCQQGYYGTGEKGHLVPREFDCVTCTHRITMDEMLLFPARGVQEHETKVDTAPWLDAQRLGWPKAWLRTVFQGLVMPNALIRGVPAESGTWSAWRYAIVTSAIFSTLNIGVFLGLVFLIAILFGGGGGAGGALSMGTALVISLVSVWLGLLVLAGLWGLVTHAMLLILGGGKWPMRRTFHAICYSMGGAALIAVPLLGIYPFLFVPLLWWMVSAMVMVGIAQGVGPGKAILATGTFPFLMTIIVFGGLFALVFVSLTMARSTMQQTQAAAATNAATIVQQDIIPAAELTGTFPEFALQAVDADVRDVRDFVSPLSMTDHSRVVIGGKTLMDLAGMTPEAFSDYVQGVAEAMPEDVVAHRIGDVVFTYHGLAVDETDAQLWTTVLAPAPLPGGAPSFGPPGFRNQITVVFSDGSSISYPVDQFDSALEEQNDLRDAYDLPDLPDPRTITLTEPVVRENGERVPYESAAP